MLLTRGRWTGSSTPQPVPGDDDGLCLLVRRTLVRPADETTPKRILGTPDRPADFGSTERLTPERRPRVLENVGIGLNGDCRAATLGALRSVGLAERDGDWPSILSGGQRQRVALARARV